MDDKPLCVIHYRLDNPRIRGIIVAVGGLLRFCCVCTLSIGFSLQIFIILRALLLGLNLEPRLFCARRGYFNVVLQNINFVYLVSWCNKVKPTLQLPQLI